MQRRVQRTETRARFLWILCTQSTRTVRRPCPTRLKWTSVRMPLDTNPRLTLTRRLLHPSRSLAHSSSRKGRHESREEGPRATCKRQAGTGCCVMGSYRLT